MKTYKESYKKYIPIKEKYKISHTLIVNRTHRHTGKPLKNYFVILETDTTAYIVREYIYNNKKNIELENIKGTTPQNIVDFLELEYSEYDTYDIGENLN